MDTEQRLARMVERLELLNRKVEALEERFARNEQRLGEVMEAISSLARIAEAHEHRVDDLDSK